MPLKLNVGLSRKIGLPNYGSLGASCHLEIELDAQLITRDRYEFDLQVHQAFEACSQAVAEELDRHVASPHPPTAGNEVPAEDSHSNSQVADHNSGGTNGTSKGGTNGRPQFGAGRSRRRQATSSQIRAIFAIAGRQNVNLEQALKDRFGVAHPSELEISDASRFIDELQSLAAGTGGNR